MLHAYETYHFRSRRKKTRKKGILLLRYVLLFLLVYFLVTGYLLSSHRVSSHSMKPGIMPGERYLVFPMAYRIKLPFAEKSLNGFGAPKRGDLVIADSPRYPKTSFFQRLAEPLVRLATLQKAGIVRYSDGSRADRFLLKRVIGVPGDTVKMEGFAAYIRTRGSSDFRLESAVIPVEYRILTQLDARGWTEDLPFSGNMEPTTLSEGEYFLLGDNRVGSNDSRYWGPVSADRLAAKVVVRYWPFRKTE
jgi:signal peptidase I